MSAQEQAVRDVVIAKLRELRTEMSSLAATIATVEKEVRAQPLTKELDIGSPISALEGWVQSMMESVAVIALCSYRVGGAGTSNRFLQFSQNLSMSLSNWRTYYIDDSKGPPRQVIRQPDMPAKALKNHEDVRRALSNRSGKPAEPMRIANPRTVYPSG